MHINRNKEILQKVLIFARACAMMILLVKVSKLMGGFPSGQRGQTVNLLRFASVVRIHLRPCHSPVYAGLLLFLEKLDRLVQACRRGEIFVIKADFHTHTTWCDGANTTREMVEAACRLGYTDFGVSGHADFSMIEPGFGMSEEKLSAYKRELLALREEFAGRMNVYIGIELDALGPMQEAEYAIGSTHCVKKLGEYVVVDDTEEKLVDWVERLWKGDWYAFAQDYFALEATVYDRTGCDWVGHFDLLTKFNEGFKHFDENSDAYMEPALAAMKRLNAAGLPFEINTGAISRRYRTTPYPSKRLLRELFLMGGRIMINSDSHNTASLGCGFEQAIKLAGECGFRRLTVLNPGGGFRELEL